MRWLRLWYTSISHVYFHFLRHYVFICLVYHTYCVGLFALPDEDWYCPKCEKESQREGNLALSLVILTHGTVLEGLSCIIFDRL
jgi:hypothetical protein